MQIVAILGIIGIVIGLSGLWVMVFANPFYLNHEKIIDRIASVGVVLIFIDIIIILFHIYSLAHKF